MSIKKNKDNLQFMILSAIGIVMVVDAHSWTVINIGNSIFPYNSFFMAMFIFISGYFYKVEESILNPLKYIKRKFFTLFLPYLVWWFVYLTIAIALAAFTSIDCVPEKSAYNFFIGPLVCGEFNGLNAPAYFVPVLFYVYCIYTLLRKLLSMIWNDYAFMAAFIASGCMVVSYSISINHAFNYNSPFMMIMKIMFSLQFFEAGVLYKKRLERHFNKIPVAVVVVVTIVCIRVINRYVPDINWTLNRLSFSPDILKYGSLGLLIPLTTSVIGISFWLVVSRILVPSLGSSKLCNYISNHTFGIMEHHIFCMEIVNLLLLGINSVRPLKNLDVDAIQSSAWYRFEWNGGTDFYAVYFFTGLIGACLICAVVDHVRKRIETRQL